MIDWLSAKSELLLNPGAPVELRARYQVLYRRAPALAGHLWLTTSGSTGDPKLVGISKEAFLASARAVNAHLQSSADDRWLLALPTFHVGGLGILARGFLSSARVVSFEGKWDARRFVHMVEESAITLSSLVPAQLYDLVQQKIAAPASLRALVIGGGAVDRSLYAKAREFGWNILPSYGLTECASQVATAPLASLNEAAFPPLELLSHLQGAVGEDNRFAFSGSSLFTGYLQDRKGVVSFRDPKQEGWFLSDDRGEIRGRELIFRGRINDVVKIGGENVDLAALEGRLLTVMHGLHFPGDAALLALPDERLGMMIHLAIAFTDGVSRWRQIVERELLAVTFNRVVYPFERIRKTHVVDKIPRSSLGKVLREELRRCISVT